MTKRLVAGPPCAGKTTFVRARALPNEHILDFDDIVEELTGDRYGPRGPEVIAQARQLWVRTLPDADWVIWTAPRRVDRGRFRSQHKAEVFVVWAPQEICLERARAQRPDYWQSWIHEWFAQWEPLSSGQETIVSGAPGARQSVGPAGPVSPNR